MYTKALRRGAVAWYVLFAAGALAESPLLTVMTYNIGSAAGIPLGRDVIARIAGEIVNASADLVGMTEIDIGTERHGGRDMIGELAVALAEHGYPMHRYYTPTLFHHGGCMALVIWSRWPIVDAGYRITVEMPGEEWKVASATTRLPDGRRLSALMVHYWIGDGSRHGRQTETVIDYARSLGAPCVIMGDFNFTPDAPYYRAIVDARFAEACQTLRGEPCPTVARGGEVGLPPIYQIDYIFAGTGLSFVDVQVGPTTQSDHWPLTARLRWEP